MAAATGSRFSVEELERILKEDESVGELYADRKECALLSGLKNFFQGVLEEQEQALLRLCANIGVVDSDQQNKLRERRGGELKDNLVLFENYLSELSGPFIFGNETAGQLDVLLFDRVYPTFALLMKPEDRAVYPYVSKWFEQCMKSFGDELGLSHMLGKVRIGDQIDCRSDPKVVRVHADRTNMINASMKKKKTQRQIEKEAKAKANQQKEEPTALKFSLTSRIPSSASPTEKVDMVRAAFAECGVKHDGAVVFHPAAHTMNEMPDELRKKGGFVCKNLFLKAKKAREGVENDSMIWLVCVPETAQVDYKSLSSTLGYKAQLRQAKPEILKETMDLLPGGVTPLGLINDCLGKVNLVLDREMMKCESNKLFLHPLTNEVTMEVTAGDLLALVRATGRNPVLADFNKVHSGTQGTEAHSGEPDVKAEVTQFSHEDARDRLWARLDRACIIREREVNPDLSAKRPVGHSSHNLFVKDKKSNTLYMICLLQSTNVGLSSLAKLLGAKELRLSSNAKTSLSIEKGCLSCLSLYNNTKGDVVPVFDQRLLDLQMIRVCAGCADPLDHSQHNVVSVSPKFVLQLLKECGSPEPIIIDVESS